MVEGGGASLHDLSVYQNHGVISGPTWAMGRSGPALSLDGTDDNIVVSNRPSLNITAAISIVAWIKRATNNPTSPDMILSKDNGTGSNDDATAWDFELFIRGDAAPVNVPRFYSDGNGSVTSSVAIGDTNWHHVAVTIAATALTFYIDGLPAGTGTVSNAFNANAFDITLGHDHFVGNEFDGSLDDIRLYNRALTPGEIVSLYTDPYLEFERRRKYWFAPSNVAVLEQTHYRWRADDGELGVPP